MNFSITIKTFKLDTDSFHFHACIWLPSYYKKHCQSIFSSAGIHSKLTSDSFFSIIIKMQLEFLLVLNPKPHGKRV